MRLGLLLYGSLDTVSGGFLYDRELVRYLRGQGEEVEVFSLPWRAYGRGLLDNFAPGLYRRLRGAAFDLLIQDELAHPSCLWLNRRLRRNRAYPIISLIHHLRASEPWPALQQRLYRVVERLPGHGGRPDLHQPEQPSDGDCPHRSWQARDGGPSRAGPPAG